MYYVRYHTNCIEVVDISEQEGFEGLSSAEKRDLLAEQKNVRVYLQKRQEEQEKQEKLKKKLSGCPYDCSDYGGMNLIDLGVTCQIRGRHVHSRQYQRKGCPFTTNCYRMLHCKCCTCNTGHCGSDQHHPLFPKRPTPVESAAAPSDVHAAQKELASLGISRIATGPAAAPSDVHATQQELPSLPTSRITAKP